MKTELRIRIKNLFAKAVNNGMTPEEANDLFKNSIREVRGQKTKQKKIDC